MSNQEYICCICGEKFTGWGNNPWPVVKKGDARCCEMCDATVVIPARLIVRLRNKK